MAADALATQVINSHGIEPFHENILVSAADE